MTTLRPTHTHIRTQKLKPDNQATRPLDPFFMHFCTGSVHTPHSPPYTFFGDKVAGTQLTAHLDMLWELDLQVEYIALQVERSLSDLGSPCARVCLCLANGVVCL